MRSLANDDDGGGVYARRGGVQVYDSTISDNNVDGSGGESERRRRPTRSPRAGSLATQSTWFDFLAFPAKSRRRSNATKTPAARSLMSDRAPQPDPSDCAMRPPTRREAIRQVRDHGTLSQRADRPSYSERPIPTTWFPSTSSNPG
jgi:hypothetical protein